MRNMLDVGGVQKYTVLPTKKHTANEPDAQKYLRKHFMRAENVISTFRQTHSAIIEQDLCDDNSVYGFFSLLSLFAFFAFVLYPLRHHE